MFFGRLFALFAALASSGTPVFARMLYEAGWSPWQVIGARFAIGFFALAIWLRRDLLLVRRDWRGSMVVMASMTVGMAAYVFSVSRCSMGTAVSLVYLAPAWVTTYQRMRGTPERYDILATAMLLLGVACVVGPGGNGDTWPGIAAAALAGLMNAAFTIAGTRATRSVPPPVIACVGMFAGMLTFGWTLADAPWTLASAPPAVGMGIVSGAGMVALGMLAFKRIGTEARMWFPFDLVVVWIVQTILQRHVPHPVTLVGATLILSAALLLAYGTRKPVASKSRSSS
ncbi:hypothetical protein A2348_04110 [Candidatus Uhrbacteria bacterium RIFOXYB12_FULL_58_10]|uniref:EamA domain-containing protein n=1 Tax=Candidatus Uhrbacteria bacterium RIFOXYB2_FULL_57_15 TaxID=1802422 RepID=A0A1F7W5H7_9BACT|nr:MAG: hypothetical protein A2348_04110 [Candidatus Uhrbacteria bacterium RIFOXYB12_FULL_58_10]OGL97896.1 MAG: hypothetical protein A2304_03140 [Candidatus Uhrbacteria bacterium RIFOXYB2_FULL_57_15]